VSSVAAIKQIKSILFNVVICDWSRYLQAWRALTITKERSYDESTCKLVKSVSRSPSYKRTTDYSNRETIDDIEDGPSAKRAAIDDQYPKSAASCVSFRVSAKCSGSASRLFTPQVGFEVIIFVPQKRKKNRKFPHGNFHSMRKNNQLLRPVFCASL